MPFLTPELIANFPLSRHADPGSIQRGRVYHKDGRVWDVELVNDSKAVLIVDGDSGEYTVEIEVNKKTGTLLFECDCPYANDGNFCKHMVAALLELKDFLEEENEFDDDYEKVNEDDEGYIPRKPISPPPAPVRNWEKKLGETLALTPHRTTSPNLTWYAAVVLLTRSQLEYSGYGSSARDTVEEKILQLQEKKRALVKSIFSTEASFFKSLTKDDVKSLFS